MSHYASRIALTLLASATLCAGVAGCATTPVPASDASPASTVYAPALTQPRAGTAVVTVTRDTGLSGSACNDVVYADGEKVAALGTGQTVTMYLSPGHHVLGTTAAGICAGGSASVEMTLAAGDRRDYRIGSRQSGDLLMQPSAF